MRSTAVAVLSHKEFLADGVNDPRRQFAETLTDALASSYDPIIVYSAYEQTRLKELAVDFPDLSAALKAVIARLVDLLPVVRSTVYFPEFAFSNSIKSVAPALCPGFSYGDLDGVADGAAASAAFIQLASGALTAPKEIADLRAQLLAYCKRDTLAMVEAHKALMRLTAKKGTLESIMANKDKSAATWSDVKAKLGDFDRAGLLGLVQDLYAASKDNQNFLHTRFGLGCDVLKPYKTIIERWLWPDVYKDQQYSVSKAKKPITDYKKASGVREGLAELTVYYCEQAIGFSNAVGLDDEGYYDALVRMFKQALETVMALPKTQRESFLDRLQDVRASGQGIGWGVGDTFNDLWRRAGLEFDN